MRGRLLVISGPSGSGKSSIVRELLTDSNIVFSVSATTRPPRPGEIQGSHYDFVQPAEFERMISDGELLEWAVYNHHLYGTPAAPVDEALAAGRDVLLEIELQGARRIRETRPEAVMFFVAPPDMEELERRLRGRGDTAAPDIADRLTIADGEIAEAAALFDHFVVNDDLRAAVDEIRGLITGRISGNLS